MSDFNREPSPFLDWILILCLLLFRKSVHKALPFLWITSIIHAIISKTVSSSLRWWTKSQAPVWRLKQTWAEWLIRSWMSICLENGIWKRGNRAWSNFPLVWRIVASELQLTMNSCITLSYSLETTKPVWFEIRSLYYEKSWIMTILEISPVIKHQSKDTEHRNDIITRLKRNTARHFLPS